MATRKRTTKPKKTSKKKNLNLVQSLNNLRLFLRSERTYKWLGGISLFIALSLFISFLSYFFTWGKDQSFVGKEWLDFLLKSDLETSNLGGRIGTLLGHIFIYTYFGVASFILCITLSLTGIKLFFRHKITYALSRVYLLSFVGILLIAPLAAYLGKGYDFPYGGGVGNYIYSELSRLMGEVLTLLALSILLLVYLVNLFHIDISELKEAIDYKLKPFLNKVSTQFGAVGNFVTEKANTVATAKKTTPNSKKVKAKKVTNTPTSKMPTKEEIEEVKIKHGQQVKLPLEEQHLVKPKRNRKQKTPVDPNASELIIDQETLKHEKTVIEEENKESKPAFEEYDPTADLTNYKKPSLSLLTKYGRDLYDDSRLAVDMEELEQNKIQIIETLSNYNIEISSITATPGPTVTLYQIIPAPGVRISKIKNLEDDIALSLAALGIRIIAPMPGRGTIGIEVPNQTKEIVSLYAVLSSQKFQQAKMDLPIGLGRTISDENFVADLAKMPHLLLAGATGQGKSVCLNSILVSLLYKKHPAELKIVMIDPKKVELSLFNVIENHFLAKLPNEEEAIVTDVKKVINTLNSLCIEMDERYDLLKKGQVRNIRGYNKKFKKRKLNPMNGHRYLPYIVLVIDEFADLIMTAGKEVEMPIARLAQLARAVGIHLIIATQRPTVNIITGTIKANFPVRIAFRVTSKVDSRTILDRGGANQLIGRGDMLLSIGSDLIRLQGAFVDTPEVEEIAAYIASQQAYPSPLLLPEYREDDNGKGKKSGAIEFDDLFEEAAHIIVQHQQGSTSLLQRRLKLGYNRAGRIMDQLEASGVVGPNIGSKAREVYIPDAFELEKLFELVKQNKY